MKNFEQMDHTADVALKIFGVTQSDFLKNAVAGLSSLLTDPNSVRMSDTRQIVIKADNLEDLLVDLLNELLFLFDTEQFISAGLNILEYRDFHSVPVPEVDSYNQNQFPGMKSFLSEEKNDFLSNDKMLQILHPDIQLQ